jgi:hypothetical protein
MSQQSANYITLTRESLYELVWSEPMSQLAKEFGITDVALAKRCRVVDVPIPYRGYWARKAAGQNPPQLPLPKYRRPAVANEEAERIPPRVVPKEIIRDGQEPTVRFGLRDGFPRGGGESSAAASPGEQDVRERLAVVTATPVASILQTCAAVKRTAKHLKHPRRRELRFERAEVSGALVDLDTSPAVLDRALLLADTFLRVAESMGWTFVAPEPSEPRADSDRWRGNDVAELGAPPPPMGRLLVEGEPIEFRIEERVREEPREPTRAELAREKREYWYHAPRVNAVSTGALRLVRIDSSGWYGKRRTSWYDHRGNLVETKIPKILQDFYEHALVLRMRRAKAEQEERQRQEEARRQRELEQQRERNAALAKHLEIEAGAWFRARLLRRYVRALKGTSEGKTVELLVKEQRVNFLRWAERYVNQLDPLHPEPRESGMSPEPNPYYRADEEALRESLARITGLQWHRVPKIRHQDDQSGGDEVDGKP